jgi:hypothetical protein
VIEPDDVDPTESPPAAETSCERGNHYLDRRLLVDTVAGADAAFLPR